jgi:hypothetical protein
MTAHRSKRSFNSKMAHENLCEHGGYDNNANRDSDEECDNSNPIEATAPTWLVNYYEAV